MISLFSSIPIFDTLLSMHQQIQTESILFQSTPYQERALLLTCFTKKCGLIRLIAQRKKESPLSPLTQGDLIFLKKNQNLHRLIEFSSSSTFPKLRQSLLPLMNAGKMTQLIQKICDIGSPAPNLYLLLNKYFELLPNTPDPDKLLISFFLKLLRHEGLIALHKNVLHIQDEAMQLSPCDYESVLILANSKKIHEIKNFPIPSLLKATLSEKIKTFCLNQ